MPAELHLESLPAWHFRERGPVAFVCGLVGERCEVSEDSYSLPHRQAWKVVRCLLGDEDGEYRGAGARQCRHELGAKKSVNWSAVEVSR